MEFAAAKAIVVPLTYDEAATYIRYISTDFLTVFNFEVATNHFINTLLTKLFYLVGGNSEVVLRLPNLLAYAMYLWFSLLILRGLSRPVMALAGFMLLNLNPYVLDYFSVSRGYGISLAFLMGALFFFFRFLARSHADAGASRDLSGTLLFAGAAVLANFSLLNVYLAIFAVTLAAAFAARTNTNPASATGTTDLRMPCMRRSFGWLPLVAVVFTILVLSQDLGLSEKLYEPVQVTVAGLNEAELDATMVSRIDVRGRATGLPFDGRALGWRMDHPTQVAGLRIELPLSAASRLGRIEVVVGHRPFWFDQRHDDTWKSRDTGTTRVLESGPSLSLPTSRVPAFRSVINWAGDARYLAYLTGYTALVLAALGALALMLKVVGTLAVRAKLLRPDHWCSMASGALWLAALIGCPLYLLQRESQLYYGGTQGLIQDAFYSLIGNSFYDRTYFRFQTPAVFGGIVLSLAAFIVVYGRRKVPGVRQGLCLLAIMVIASIASIAERLLFHTPYPLGRTALFYVPMYVLFFTFLCAAIAEYGRMASMFATFIMLLAVSFSMYHFTAAANLTYILDWRRDADTRAMIEDLGRVVATERSPGLPVVLAVDPFFSAAAAFYASKSTAANITLVVVPTPSDFLYLADRNQEEPARVIRRYPVAGGVLARVGPP